MSKNKLMTYWEHVYEIRNRLLLVIGSVLMFTIGGYFFFPVFIKSIQSILGETLYATQIAEGFLTRLKVGFLTGLFLTIPVFFVEIILFLFPALNKRQKLFFSLTMCISFLLFLVGIFFAYKSVLPLSVRFLKSKIFFPEEIDRIISYTTYINFFFQFLFGFGICFQFPIVVIFLMKIKIISVNFLLKNYKYFIIIVFLIAALLTPPDIMSQVLLGIPMLFLYGICILIGKIFKLGKE